MSPGTAPRVRIALSLTLPLLLIAGITMLSSAGTATPMPTVDEPQFLTWSGDPFDDGLSHFLVEVGATSVADDRWLRRDDEGVLTAATDDPIEITVTVDELAEAVAGIDASTTVDEDAIVASLAALDGVHEARSLAFGIVAVSGDVTAAEIAAVPGVVRVDRDAPLRAATVDEYYPSQWALENDGDSPEQWVLEDDADIDAPEGWHRTRGAGVVVAVIDSGVDITHPDLAANIWRNPGETCGNGIDDDGNGYVDDCNGWDFAGRDAGVEDYNGHGTHVAGIIAAEANNGIGIAGVAYESEVMVLKIGDGTPALSAALEAIGYAVDNGARVINASWGVDDPLAGSYLEPALEAAADAGVLVVTGAGNDGNDIDDHPVFPGASPNPNVITVGASTAQDLPASFSGFGAESVDLFAPGEHIVSTLPSNTYGAYSGTSMATPMVTAAAALLWSATPKATAAEVKAALLDRSDGPNDGVASFRNLAVSDGRLNIQAAIYTRLFQPSLMFTFHDFNSFHPDTLHGVTIQAQTIDPWIDHPQTPSMYRAGLYVPLDGQPMAVVGQEIVHTVDGAEATAVTDGTGRALVGSVFEPEERSQLVQDGDFTELAMELPAGTYAFVMEIVDVTDPAAPVVLGDPSAVFFIVGDDGSVTEMPGTPIGGGGSGGGAGVTPPGDDDPAATTTTQGATATSTTGAPDPGDGDATTTTIPATSTTSPGGGGATTTTTAPTTTDAPAEDAGEDATTTTTTAAPGDGSDGTTSTTTAPDEEADGGGETTTTTPTTTVPPDDGTGTTTTTVPATTNPPPAEGMRITDVDPAEGPASGSTLVTITGAELPVDPEVWFGSHRASLVAVVAPTFIVVETPSGAPGPVDVTVIDRDGGAEAVYPNGYLYLDDGSGGPTTTTSVDTTSTTDAGGATTTTAAPTTPDGPGIDEWLDDMLRTPEGLTLAPVGSDLPIASIPVSAWAGNLCNEPVCPGWVLP